MKVRPVAGNHKRVSRNLCAPNGSVFCARYSAQVLLARFSSKTDFCSFSDSDGFAKRSLNQRLLSTDSREKNTAEPVQFGKVRALLKSFSQRFRLVYSLKSFWVAIR